MKQRNKEILSVVFLYLLSGYFFFKASEFRGDAGLFPRLLSGAVAILNTIHLITVLTTNVENSRNKEDRESRKLLIIIFLSILYILLIKPLGFVVSSLVFLISTVYLLDVKNKKMGMAIAIITIALIYIAFGIILKVKIPMGIFRI